MTGAGESIPAKLQEQGSDLAKSASVNGLSGLSFQELTTLSLYETWKDGADWGVIEEMQENPEDPAEYRRMLIEQYGYNQ